MDNHFIVTIALPKIYVQNASLNRHTHVLESILIYRKNNSFTNESEGIDINSVDDWRVIKSLLEQKLKQKI